jgi:nucleoside-diphosphate-sugar epimerase
VRGDTSKPDGQMFKRFDVARMEEWLGYRCPTTLREGLTNTIAWFEQHYDHARLAVPV